jgi:glucokinase-like ROK family protein
MMCLPLHDLYIETPILERFGFNYVSCRTLFDTRYKVVYSPLSWLTQQTNIPLKANIAMAAPKVQRTGNQTLVREINLAAIMNQLHSHAPISRAALAEKTGLNKTTVSSLIQELLDLHFVRETGLESVGTGRPAIMLELNPNVGIMVSAEIGVDFISVLCSDFAVQTIWNHKEVTNPEIGHEAILNRTLALIRKAIEAGQNVAGNVLGVAVGVPGLVDRRDGAVLFAPNLKWQNIPLRTTLQESFNTQIFVNNEANLAALGEYTFGAARAYHEMLYVSAGVGLGGGIIYEGHLFNGGTGFAGEFGHMTMDPDGEYCNCGNRGCWETQASQSALFRYIEQAVRRGRSSTLIDKTNNDLSQLTVSLVVEAAGQDDAVALEALEKVGRYLGIGLASLVNALNPELVVFGGILSLAGNFLLPAIDQELEHRALRWNESAAKVVLSQHGINSCVMGGAATIYHAVLNQPGKMTKNNN